ncbi:MAG: hypothetical protein M3N98_10825 [Actinomycetota bacterium]|nr:hypothetical protein [Actinomycetota bacterium]
MVIEGGDETRFDVQAEAALLIGPLAKVDEDHAAGAARRLVAACDDTLRTLATLAILGYTSGPTIKAVLEELSGHGDPEVGEYARLSLAHHRQPAAAATASAPAKGPVRPARAGCSHMVRQLWHQ